MSTKAKEQKTVKKKELESAGKSKLENQNGGRAFQRPEVHGPGAGSRPGNNAEAGKQASEEEKAPTKKTGAAPPAKLQLKGKSGARLPSAAPTSGDARPGGARAAAEQSRTMPPERRRGPAGAGAAAAAAAAAGGGPVVRPGIERPLLGPATRGGGTSGGAGTSGRRTPAEERRRSNLEEEITAGEASGDSPALTMQPAGSLGVRGAATSAGEAPAEAALSGVCPQMKGAAKPQKMESTPRRLDVPRRSARDMEDIRISPFSPVPGPYESESDMMEERESTHLPRKEMEPSLPEMQCEDLSNPHDAEDEDHSYVAVSDDSEEGGGGSLDNAGFDDEGRSVEATGKTGLGPGGTRDHRGDDWSKISGPHYTLPGVDLSSLVTIDIMEKLFDKLIITIEKRVESKLDKMGKQFETIINELQGNIDQIENKVEELCQSHDILSSENQELRREVMALKVKMADYEDRDRRVNIKIRGIPEEVKQKDLESYVTSLFRAILPDASEHDLMQERTHRVFKPKYIPENVPRDVLTRFHHFKTKEKILQISRGLRQLPAPYKNIQLYTDLSADTMQRRRELNPVSSHLRDQRTPYRWLYPTRLLVIKEGVSHTISRLEEADDFLKDLGLPPLPERQGGRPNKGTPSHNQEEQEWRKVPTRRRPKD